MNKKFSTLLAGAALLSAMSVNAQTAVDKLVKGDNSGLYQIAVGQTPGSSVLSMDTDGKLTIVTVGNNDYVFENTLWCVRVASEDQGQNPKFDFLNKGTGLSLDFSTEAFAGKALAELTATTTPIEVGGNVSGWAFSKQITTLQQGQPIYSYFTEDSVVGLSKDKNGKLALIKTGAGKVASNVDNATNKFLPFTLQNAAAVRLTDENVNTILGLQTADKGVKLTFTPDEKGVENMKDLVRNPFSVNKFFAEKLATTDADAADYVRVYKKIDDVKNYLRVDTSYTNQSGTKFLAFKWVKEADMTADATYANQYKFAFTYYPSIDSLVIQVKSVERVKDGVDFTYWKDVAAVDKTTTNAVLDNLSGTDGEKNYVTVQDLLKDQVRIITIADKKESDVNLGFAGCKQIPTEKTTVADGLYYIISKDGTKYLASPIYENGEKAMWVSVNIKEQNPAHMPAYQWIVLKDKPSATTSTVSIYNREFSDTNVKNANAVNKSNLQLTQKEGSTLYLNGILNTDSIQFVQIKDSAIIKDSQLGYKKLNSDSLMVNKYTFNYWHPYATNKYIAKSGKDSTLTVLDGKDQFVLVEGTNQPYGYNASKVNKDRIKGLAQLHRTDYAVKLDTKSLGKAAEEKYAVGTFVNGVNVWNDYFYFKENNCFDGKHYHAIVKRAYNNYGVAKGYTGTGVVYDLDPEQKAGVSDYDGNATLKVQKINETRTSAFYIAPDETPLYRRFNNVALGESASDAADSLMFVESIRQEYLMDEPNGNLTDEFVDYVGIWSKDKANGKLAFRIDTAWLNRGVGKIKPQYLISTGTEVVQPTRITPCTEEGPHIDKDGNITKDPSQCVHAHVEKLPGFTYGKYMVNFSDSAEVYLAKKANPYINSQYNNKDSYTRVGFVKAIQAGDSLFVLTNGFEKMKPADLDTVSIIKAYKAATLDEKFIVNLKGDNHKNVTWSFRYVNPENAANVTKEGEANAFLFESNVYKDTENYRTAVKSDVEIAPTKAAAWLKMHNGCLVLTDAASEFSSAKVGGDGALIFNAYPKTENDDMVTSNDKINNAEGVSIVANNGTVTIQGAAGKSVVITNILGKVVAETALTSDNATISVPAGIVAVAVDGEEAVKVVVK